MPDMFAVLDAAGRLVSTGTVVAQQLPAGLTARALTVDEVAAMRAGAAWDATLKTFGAPPPPPPPPLIDPAEYPPEDERVAADALLTEDSVGYRAVIELLIAKGIISPAEVAAAQAAALARLAALSADPALRDEMIRDRLR